MEVAVEAMAGGAAAEDLGVYMYSMCICIAVYEIPAWGAGRVFWMTATG